MSFGETQGMFPDQYSRLSLAGVPPPWNFTRCLSRLMLHADGMAGAEPDRRMRLLEWFGLHGCVLQLPEPPVEVDPWLGPKCLHQPQSLVEPGHQAGGIDLERDRKSTRLNSSHITISYAVFCLKKKKKRTTKKQTKKKKTYKNTT